MAATANSSCSTEQKLPEIINGMKRPSFCYTTITDRWPKIVTRLVDQLHKYQREAQAQYGQEGDEDVKSVIGKLSQLKYLMGTDKPLQDIDAHQPVDGNIDDSPVWNAELSAYRGKLPANEVSWFHLPWLFTECYLYRKIWEFLQATRHLRNYDPFGEEKERSYWDSANHLLAIGAQVKEAIEKGKGQESQSEKTAETNSIVLELLQIQIWGNKCDLSLSGGDPHFMSESIFHELEELRPHILADDLQRCTDYIVGRGSPAWQLDIVLDNAGLEVFTDLCLADFLQERELAGKVVFHGKAIPWFVSDTTRRDIEWVMTKMVESKEEVLRELGTRWRKKFAEGVFIFEAHPFWTWPFPYCEMHQRAPDLYEQLTKANLIILKGDLNYRKLVGDRYWPLDTPFKASLCGFEPAPLIALRTLKAETCAGLPQKAIAAMAKKFGEENKEWMVSSDYAVAQMLEK